MGTVTLITFHDVPADFKETRDESEKYQQQ
jgi:hypothetical protein